MKKCVVIPKFASVKWKTSNNIAAYGETGSCTREQWGEEKDGGRGSSSGGRGGRSATLSHTVACMPRMWLQKYIRASVCAMCVCNVCVCVCVCGLCMCVCVYEMCHVDSVEMSLMRRRNEFCQHRVAQSPQPQPTKYPCKCSLTPALAAFLLSLCIQNFAVQLSTTRRMSNAPAGAA